ncbi:MAG: hypothetical protein ACPG4N_04450 [Gammaproteobacteria bacterium]
MALLRSIPLFVIVLLIYNALMLTGNIHGTLSSNILGVDLPSGAHWSLNVSELLIVIGVITLYLEIFKATRTSMSSVLDHSLSMVVFVVFLLEFVMVANAGTSAFFILTLMSLLDVVAGFTVTIVAARRDFGFGNPDL